MSKVSNFVPCQFKNSKIALLVVKKWYFSFNPPPNLIRLYLQFYTENFNSVKNIFKIDISTAFCESFEGLLLLRGAWHSPEWRKYFAKAMSYLRHPGEYHDPSINGAPQNFHTTQSRYLSLKYFSESNFPSQNFANCRAFEFLMKYKSSFKLDENTNFAGTF